MQRRGAVFSIEIDPKKKKQKLLSLNFMPTLSGLLYAGISLLSNSGRPYLLASPSSPLHLYHFSLTCPNLNFLNFRETNRFNLISQYPINCIIKRNEIFTVVFSVQFWTGEHVDMISWSNNYDEWYSWRERQPIQRSDE